MSTAPLNHSTQSSMAKHGFTMTRGKDFHFNGLEDAWRKLTDDWKHLETDIYMADGGRYRLRRYGRFIFIPAASNLKRLPHATVFQSQHVNNFAGGIHRNFAPLRECTFENQYLIALIRLDFDRFDVTDASKLSEPWEVWVHQIRIEASGKSEVRPAPEGIHHDGHDFIAMHLVGRENVSGGLSRLYDNSEKQIFSCLLEQPLDTLYADDHRVMHAVDPICALDASRPACRDILIIDFDHKPNLIYPA